jgi:glycosyltransferase involved in cell wall biosynthesis
MNYFSQFLEAQQEGNTKDAISWALKIVERHYPSSLQDTARQYLQDAGADHLHQVSRSVSNLHALLSKKQIFKDFHDPLRWLPWRIIADSLNLSPDQETFEKILHDYELEFAETGQTPLHGITKIDDQIVKSVISPYFDPDAYRDYHVDLRGYTSEDALTHYSIHGANEQTRCPNPVFRNEEFFNLYPWTRSTKLNPLYLFIRWPEQFPDYRETVLSRCAICLSAKQTGGTREFTKYRHNPHAINDYHRVLYLVRKLTDSQKRLIPNLDHLNIHVVIPDFTEGGGGHMTIFRMILNLERAGHQCTLWIKDYHPNRHPEGPTKSATDHYQPIKARVLPLSSHFAFTSGDALIATSWDTVDIVNSHKGFVDKFYLVQDYEPFFFPRGSEALKAELTYMSDIKTICASTWLDQMMRDRFGKVSTHFDLSFEPTVYFPATPARPPSGALLPHILDEITDPRPVIRIAFYARQRTARRAVSIALEGLSLVQQENYRLCVELFGEEKGLVHLPENVVGFDNGILRPSELADLYRSCDIGLTFSATNYALVPQEMMACRLPVIEIDNESTRAIYPEEILRFAKPSPQSIAEEIDRLAQNPLLRETIADKALEWAQETSWEKSFANVNDFIRREVGSRASGLDLYANYIDFYASGAHTAIKISKVANPVVSVMIPTLNGGNLLLDIVKRLLQQKIDAAFEIIIIDSESEDHSIASLPEDPRISLYSIPRSSFQHGRTRNLGVALSKAPFLAFLTQDAMPANRHWLQNLIEPLQSHGEVVGVFGRHVGHEGHPQYLKTWMHDHFKSFAEHGLYNKLDDLRRYYKSSPEYRQFMHYYSDNNSCLRKATWCEYPYPDVAYGEDQLWADWLIQWSHTKAYAHDAVVMHSHDYTPREEFERASTEAHFFRLLYGYDLSQDRLTLEEGLASEAAQIINSTDESLQKHRSHLLHLFRAKREGYLDGVTQAVSEIRGAKVRSK